MKMIQYKPLLSCTVVVPHYKLVLIIHIKDKVVPILQITFQWGLI